MFIWICVLFQTVSKIELFECTTTKLLIRKRYYMYIMFLIPVFIFQVTELVQFIINVRKLVHISALCNSCELWRQRVVRLSTSWWSYDRTKLPRLSAKWITKTTRGCSFDYMDCYVLSAWRSPLLLYLTWCIISMTLSLIDGLVMAVPLTGHQDLQT